MSENPETSQDPPRRSVSPRDRAAVFDNARAILCWLVVIGHGLQPLVLSGNAAATTLYEFIYAFHMPAFAALSGALSSRRLSMRDVRRLLFPLLVFQILYTAFDLFYLGDWNHAYLTSPYWMLWFLLSLLFWRASLPMLLRLPHPILLSSVAALLAGLFPEIGYPFSLSRTIVFLPLFVGGHIYFHEQGCARAKPGCSLRSHFSLA